METQTKHEWHIFDEGVSRSDGKRSQTNLNQIALAFIFRDPLPHAAPRLCPLLVIC